MWQGSSCPIIPRVMSDHPGLSPAQFLLGWFSQSPLLLWCFFQVTFYPWTPTVLLGEKSLPAPALVKVESELSTHCKIPSRGPVLTRRALVKSASPSLTRAINHFFLKCSCRRAFMWTKPSCWPLTVRYSPAPRCVYWPLFFSFSQASTLTPYHLLITWGPAQPFPPPRPWGPPSHWAAREPKW